MSGAVPRLYFAPQTCARVALTALEEIGEPFETHLIAFLAGEHRQPEFLAVNPAGKVPALQTKDGIIVQNGAILAYLADTHPDAGLLPPRASAAGRAQVLSSLFHCSADLHPLVARFVLPAFHTSDAAQAPQIREIAKQGLEFQLAGLENLLAEREWIEPEGWSIIDAYVAWIWFRITGAGFPAEKFPALSSHYERVCARPSALAALRHEEEAQAELAARGLKFSPPAVPDN